MVAVGGVLRAWVTGTSSSRMRMAASTPMSWAAGGTGSPFGACRPRVLVWAIRIALSRRCILISLARMID